MQQNGNATLNRKSSPRLLDDVIRHDLTPVQTHDYDRFKILEGNRDFEDANTFRIMESMKRRFLINPIIVNKKFEIIDGQHRYTSCVKLGLPIIYIMVAEYELEEVKILNTNSSNWKKTDHLKSECILGNEPYIILDKFMKQYPCFPLSVCERLLSNKTQGSNNQNFMKGKKIRNFENGDFKVHDYNIAVANAEKLMAIKPYYKKYNAALFVGVMISLFNYPEYDHDTFLKKLQQQPTSLVPCTTHDRYLELIESIYNYRSRSFTDLRKANKNYRTK